MGLLGHLTSEEFASQTVSASKTIKLHVEFRCLGRVKRQRLETEQSFTNCCCCKVQAAEKRGLMHLHDGAGVLVQCLLPKRC